MSACGGGAMLEIITLDDATREFGPLVRAGEWVAYWQAHDNQACMVAVDRSYPTEDEAEAAGQELLDDPAYVEGVDGGLRGAGRLHMLMVVP